MTYAEVMKQVRQLSATERLLLAETILHWLRTDLQPEPDGSETQDSAETRRKRLQSIPPASALRGIGKLNNEALTDQALKDDYLNHLEQKYA